MTSDEMKPQEIEKKSFSIITEELNGRYFPKGQDDVVKRVIHATADFDYADNLFFSDDVINIASKALKNGTPIITDTQMIRSGINKKAISHLGCPVHCFMDDPEVARIAKENGTTRAVASMDKAAALWPNGIFVVGNAPTALLRICELAHSGEIAPQFVIGVPVGFVNVTESKDALMQSLLSCIVARGRKGGSTVAAAICNALIYQQYRAE